MPVTTSRLIACLASGFVLSLFIGCGSEPEPEAKAPPAPAKAKAKGKTARPKVGVQPDTAVAKAKPATNSPKKTGTVAAAKTKESAPKDQPEARKPDAKPASSPDLTATQIADKGTEKPSKPGKQESIKGPAISESFDKGSDGGLPEGWSQWVSLGGSIQLTAAKALSKPNAVAFSGGSKIAGRAWLIKPQPADVQVSAAIFLDQLIPSQVIARGKGLDGDKPTFYAASVVRGLEVKIQRVTGGAATTVAQVRSAKWFSEKWVRLRMRAEGQKLGVDLQRLDSNEYLDEQGQWQPERCWAIRATDDKIGGEGLVGIGREASYAGTIIFDDFAAGKPWDDAPQASPAVKPAAGTLAPSRPRAEAPIVKVDAPPVQRPDVPRHYPHIRIALLAYHGNPMGAFEDRLLRDSVDLVVPDERYLEHIRKVAPNTPSLIYTNTSSLYLDLLTDWLAYADRNNLSREAAFYHARAATKFGGNSPSSLAVNRFWKVLTGSAAVTDHTSAAHLKNGRVPVDGPLYLGWPDRFREINFELISGAGDGWNSVLEYPAAVDETGRPTKWAALATVTDTTSGLAQSGQVTFDPPADWKPTVIHGDMRLHFVRFRPTGSGKAPVASTILGRDYVAAKGTTSGVIPSFDADADANKDGYLDDAEYAKRAPGKDARFVHESRMFTRNYGQMRFATNPAGTGFSRWGVDYHQRFLQRHPLAAGLFMDNSEGKAPVDAGDVLEPVHQYAADYGAMLGTIEKAIAPRWVLANTAGGGRHCEPVVQYNPAYFEEFMLRPLAHNWTLFEDVAEAVERRAKLTTPPPLAVLDSHPAKGKVDDSRMQLGVLAYYYLLADPDRTYLTFFGGYEPGTPWHRHWSPAVAFDVGRPTVKWSVFATGTDPAAADLTYKVYQRTYENALVLYKPLSHGRGARTAATAEDNTATRHDLGGTYQQVQPDGTLGPPITSIPLRNGEGTILAKMKP
jgi:hypothetical protein